MSASQKCPWMKLKRLPLSSWSGALFVVLYLGLVIVSYLFYPTSFGPGGNWLSDLGDNNLNPDGAMYYRLAGILGGLVLILFSVGLKDWYGGQRSKSRMFMSIAQSFGVLTSFAFVMTGCFSEDDLVPHLFWSLAGTYVCFGTVVFVGFALLYYRSVPKLFSVFCFVVAAVDVISGAYRKAHWLEWPAAAMSLIFVASVSYLTHRHVNQAQ